jgi:hypothetical protein
MGGNDIRTTLNPFGIGTSFISGEGRTYFVSTVENPPDSNQFETLIKIAHEKVSPICLIAASNPKDAVINHIAVARMVISTERSSWNEREAVDFVPVQLVKLQESIEINSEINSLNSEYCKTLLRMSGLNYASDSERNAGKPSRFHQIAYLSTLLLGGIGGFSLGSEFGGTVLAIISAIFFALVCSTAVGAIAMKFGYQP